VGAGRVRVHLGPGQKKYLKGWINVDANFLTAKCDIWADLRDPLPFPDGSVDAFYSSHVIEHLPDHLLPFHFEEMHRCLKPGGCIRVGGPNGDAAIRQYLAGDIQWFSDFPDKRVSVGGRLANFILCRGEHLSILTPSYIFEIAFGQGFDSLRCCRPETETNYPQIFDELVLQSEWGDCPTAPHTLVVEAEKPQSTSKVSESV
jgi:predicted SAM-dependent methyltransferase